MNRARARELRNNPTNAERFLWSHLRLRQLGGHKFRRQQPVGPYIVDFVCLEKRLIIEVDGITSRKLTTTNAVLRYALKVLRFLDSGITRF